MKLGLFVCLFGKYLKGLRYGWYCNIIVSLVKVGVYIFLGMRF